MVWSGNVGCWRWNARPSSPESFYEAAVAGRARRGKGLTPGYTEKSFGSAPTGQLTLIASRGGRNGSVAINQDADLLLAKFAGGESITHGLCPQRHAWVLAAEGEVSLNGQRLKTGDAASVSRETEWHLASDGLAQAVVFDLN